MLHTLPAFLSDYDSYSYSSATTQGPWSNPPSQCIDSLAYAHPGPREKCSPRRRLIASAPPWSAPASQPHSPTRSRPRRRTTTTTASRTTTCVLDAGQLRPRLLPFRPQGLFFLSLSLCVCDRKQELRHYRLLTLPGVLRYPTGRRFLYLGQECPGRIFAGLV